MKQLLEKAERLQNLMVRHATGGVELEEEYSELRREFVNHSIARNLVPSFVTDCRTLDQFWQFIKHEDGTYAGRKRFLWQSFSPLVSFCENQLSNQANQLLTNQIQTFGSEYVSQEWQKSIERLHSDVEGAITIARTLIESVCKHILEEHEISCNHVHDLPALYKQTAVCLNLSPSQHNEDIFKQILGGCFSVVNGLAGVRNQFGDSHGKSSKQIKPAKRHAELAVNLAGTMASFMIQTHLAMKDKGPGNSH
ncbi:abortive infection family protein [Hymenobacter perfusus]|uniref:Abortive phage resistance protein n=1 Tax=Hymenobacter perfusus TaxID=1236770 RepID=A0A3R9MHX0_9BACT|nr:abortive infection family protein [Hymenobacter perfusus]RSK42636.1 abortive phage resistance protein [Hymenobacter perfusus]